MEENLFDLSFLLGKNFLISTIIHQEHSLKAILNLNSEFISQLKQILLSLLNFESLE